MGDFRASIKIEMEFLGIKEKADMDINYSPNDCCNMDERVTEFFNNVYERGMEIYNENEREYREKEYKDEIEKWDKIQLKKLKEKYE